MDFTLQRKWLIISTFWSRSIIDELQIAIRFEQIFHDSFAADKTRTLAVVCFSLGTWVGGMYTASCCRYLASKGYPIILITPGNNKEEILRVVGEIGSDFEQIVLLGYPPFLKDVIDTGISRGIYWREYQIELVMAGEVFSEVILNLEKPRHLWVAVVEIEMSRLKGRRKIAIVMNNAVFDEASDIDYFITNFNESVVTPEWIVKTYSQRNWVEVFYREAKGWLGLKEYQTRGKRSLDRHLILVFCAYTFILWHKLTGGLRRRWANKEIKTWTEALEAFRTAMSFRFVRWLNQNIDLFTAYKASLGLIFV